MERVYLVRYGLMGRVGRFRAGASAYGRGQRVVVRSPRGTELGDVLAAETIPAPAPAAAILRVADGHDLDLAVRVGRDRPRRLEACERIFRDGVWPLELIDVEPLLDDRRTVLHYLGPHQLDASGLVQVLSERCDLDVWLEPAGLDLAEEPAEADHGCGSCSSGGGGCGSGSGGGGGCSGCAVKDLVAGRAAAAAAR